jgi:hypothetical protein
MFDTLAVVDEGPPAWIDEYFDSFDPSYDHDYPFINSDDTPPDVTVMNDDGVLSEILGCRRQISAIQARDIRALARFAELRSDPTGQLVDEFAADELAPLLRISRGAAQAQLDLAIELTRRLPATVCALERGDLDLYKARIVAAHTHPLSDTQAAAVEQLVLPRVSTQTPGQLRVALRRAVLLVDPDGAEARRKARVQERAVLLRPGEDGTAELRAVHLDAADAIAAYQQLDVYARAMGTGDGRSMDQRRSDAMIDLILGRAESRPGGARIHVTVAAGTLLGLDDKPAELSGYGPITAQAARELAADGVWRRILTDPAGTPLEVGSATYRPSTALAEHIRLRDGTCRFPGCRHPAWRCDLDHGTPFPRGGTEPGNLSCLCRHHHRLKHERNWKMRTGEDGSIRWTSPTGRSYDTVPDPVGEPESPSAGNIGNGSSDHP